MKAAMVVSIAAVLSISGRTARAQSPSDLAKTSQNPVADLVSVPFQFNFNTGGGLPPGRALANLNVQPVFPLKMGTHWTLIARTIVPFLNIPAGEFVREDGIGDILQQFFVTPQQPGKLIWGVGPIFSFPTATNDVVRTGSWGTGPALVWLMMPGNFTIGSLIYNVWTFSDDDNDDVEVNQLAIQPIINYNMPDGWALSYAPIWTANWDADDGETWTIPLGLGVSKVTALGSQPLSLALNYFYNVARPESANASQVRFVASFLFPTRKPPPAKAAQP
jgi:hypothetical protein